MAGEGTIVVEGLAPLLRDFSRLSKTTTKRIRDRLREVAAPVAIDVRFRDRRFGAKTVRGVKVAVRQRGVAVEQTARKSLVPARRRSNFGALQQRTAFDPALADNAGATERRIGEVLEDIIEGKVL